MTTLEDAWRWYLAVRDGMRFLGRFAPHWGELPWHQPDEWVGRLAKEESFKPVHEQTMEGWATTGANALDDLAILVLFSVFEANVRDLVLADLRPEIAGLRNPTLVKAAKDAEDAVEHGSFFRLLDAYKSAATNDLIEKVNRVRRHRNWVAHGRRPESEPAELVDPKEAYDRLRQFLAVIRPPPPPAEP